MPPVVSARLLGTPQLSIDGAPAPPELLWRKHLALCIVLWAAPERRRSRDQLIGLLWSEKTDRAARHSLNEALRVIRRAAGADTIESTTDYVTWVTPPDLDTDRCAGLERDQPDAAAECITGPYCDGLTVPGAIEFESWLAAERERWLERSVEILVRAGRAAEDRGDLQRALRLARQGTALNPLSTSATRALIRACWLDGDRAAALAAGNAFRLRLEQDLGTTLDPGTAALLDRVERGRSPNRPANAANPARRAPLIGRGEQLARLLDAARPVDGDERASLIIITGPDGTGRSRLLEEVVARAELAGATTAMMRAVEADAIDAEAATIGLARAGLDGAPGVSAAPGAALAALANRLPGWSERFPAVRDTPPLPLREAFESIVRALATERPLLLAIDDVDRLQAGELRWLTALLRTSAGFDLTLLLSVRSGSGDPATDELIRRAGRDHRGTALRLEPLTKGEMRALVDWAVPAWAEDARDRLARRLTVESGGLPSVAVDVLHAIAHGGGPDAASTWPQPDRTMDATLPEPLSEPLVAAVRAAFRRLAGDAQKLLVTAALLEEPFTAARAGDVAGITDSAARDAGLDALEWDGWIVVDARGYLFPARAKRRLVTTDLMTPGQRRRLEERIAHLPE